MWTMGTWLMTHGHACHACHACHTATMWIMIKRYQAISRRGCASSKKAMIGWASWKTWKNGNDKNDHFIVSLSRATNLPAGKVGQTDWVGSIGHLNDISDYFEKKHETNNLLAHFWVYFSLYLHYLQSHFSGLWCPPTWRNFRGCTTWSDPGQQSSLALIRQEMLAGMPRWLEGWLHLLTLVVGWCWLHMRSTVIFLVSSDFCGELFSVRNWGIPE